MRYSIELLKELVPVQSSSLTVVETFVQESLPNRFLVQPIHVILFDSAEYSTAYSENILLFLLTPLVHLPILSYSSNLHLLTHHRPTHRAGRLDFMRHSEYVAWRYWLATPQYCERLITIIPGGRRVRTKISINEEAELQTGICQIQNAHGLPFCFSNICNGVRLLYA
jgi:hypothetical protein